MRKGILGGLRCPNPTSAPGQGPGMRCTRNPMPQPAGPVWDEVETLDAVEWPELDKPHSFRRPSHSILPLSPLPSSRPPRAGRRGGEEARGEAAAPPAPASSMASRHSAPKLAESVRSVASPRWPAEIRLRFADIFPRWVAARRSAQPTTANPNYSGTVVQYVTHGHGSLTQPAASHQRQTNGSGSGSGTTMDTRRAQIPNHTSPAVPRSSHGRNWRRLGPRLLAAWSSYMDGHGQPAQNPSFASSHPASCAPRPVSANNSLPQAISGHLFLHPPHGTCSVPQPGPQQPTTPSPEQAFQLGGTSKLSPRLVPSVSVRQQTPTLVMYLLTTTPPPLAARAWPGVAGLPCLPSPSTCSSSITPSWPTVLPQQASKQAATPKRTPPPPPSTGRAGPARPPSRRQGLAG